ncbi:MAG: DMT family transporter [Methylotetracoccus sp.]|nr:DMT family transporter [Methylotetracoccus sp.]
MFWTYIIIALLAGAVLPMQAAVNAQLRYVVGSSLLAALVSFGVGTAALLLYAAFARLPLPDGRAALQAPWWAWSGGLLGAFYVLTAILVAPRLGTAALMGLALAGQLIAALVLDHYGLLGLSVHPLSLWRVVGTILLLAGVALITRF